MKAYIVRFYAEFDGVSGESHVLDSFVPATLLRASRLRIFKSRIARQTARKMGLSIRSQRWEIEEKGYW